MRKALSTLSTISFPKVMGSIHPSVLRLGGLLYDKPFIWSMSGSVALVVNN